MPGYRSAFQRMLLLTCVALPFAAAADAEAPFVSPIDSLSDAEIASGQSHFRIHCARCHGMLGQGGEGPSLTRASLKHAPDDEALFEVINEGIRGTGMPGTFGPNDDTLWQIAGYVRSLGRLPPEEMPGDPQSRPGDL